MSPSLSPLNALVVINSLAGTARFFNQTLLPWLEHYGVPYVVVDLAHDPLPPDAGQHPLIILGQPGLDDEGVRLGAQGLDLLRAAVAEGSGLVSFDPALSCRLADTPAGETAHATRLQVNAGHPVTARYTPGQELALVAALDLAPIPPGETLVAAAEGGQALLVARTAGQGREVHWAAVEWMDSGVLGAMAGLDGAFWRALVWAARKPFCLRGFPPVVTMRVDDVAGWGRLWQREPLFWVKDAIQAGFKPWLGLFIYNLEEETINDLRELLLSGEATAFPHAFGRPPRDERTAHLYYSPDALALRSERYDEFIYFDHQNARPWSDAEAARGLAAVDEWYRARGPLPISKCALGHWYEMGANTARHVRETWGCEFIGKLMDFDLPLSAGIPWLRQGPFRLHEEPGESLPHTNKASSHRPVYYADTLQADGVRFFNSVTEIRDDAGYEWAPDGDAAASIGRGVRQLRRALDAMALASLFTHETDYIYKIEPQGWSEIISGIAEGIAAYQPLQMTLDEACGLLRATRASRLRGCRLDRESGEVLVTFEGQADRPTYFHIFHEQDTDLAGDRREVPPFDGFMLSAYPL
jgi:hypothetical protein